MVGMGQGPRRQTKTRSDIQDGHDAAVDVDDPFNNRRRLGERDNRDRTRQLTDVGRRKGVPETAELED